MILLFALFGITNLIAGLVMGHYYGKNNERKQWNVLLEKKRIVPVRRHIFK